MSEGGDVFLILVLKRERVASHCCTTMPPHTGAASVCDVSMLWFSFGTRTRRLSLLSRL